MRLDTFALAAVVGLAVPGIVEVVAQRPAIAQVRPLGSFRDSQWDLSLFMDRGNYYYRGQARGSREYLELWNVEFAGTPDRRVYRWYNANYTYQVVWRPADPDFVRLQVFENNREILNRLLERY
ncbi:hypothetical protein NEA10_06075 [Phormidium yuhuli AB48]|uniref:Uncharacterized protein n=1 Tax=Phormidium yuhuli AB48 TaxID=2940671 RepID=A0ABY5ATZ5_9CYAN|nr:hypothetical protein [Phormidium yuhuli]USR92287.1 hypothetical protein NEA10_06075 [Phormidium yuhuli AB48]